MPKRVLQGVVISDKQDKTVVVKVERRFTHPVMKKTVRRTKHYHAHDEGNVGKVGQTVSIQESKPHSKLKTWELLTSAGNEGGAGIAGVVGAVVDKVKAAVGLGDKA